ncbi:MAG: adenylate kinase [Anaerolineae bacterium]
MEIEAKYTVLDADAYAAIARLPEIAGFTVRDGGVLDIVDTYLDTRDYRITSAGYGCRCRQEASRSILTLKALGRGTGPVHRREELAVELAGECPRTPTTWPDSPVRALAMELIDQKELIALFRIEQERRIRHLVTEAGTRIADLSLDRVEIRNGSQSQRFAELEIELVEAGSEEDLDRITASLDALLGLVAQPTSKYERGLALMARRDSRIGVAAIGRLRVTDTMGEAVTKLLRPLYLRMEIHEQGTYLGEDPEELHDMRVATRRMRTALRVAKPYLDAKATRRARRRLRRTARVLGDVRDMDVFRYGTEAYLEKTGTDPVAVARLTEIWNVEYARRRNAMLVYLSGPDYSAFKQEFWGRLQEGVPDRKPVTHVSEIVQESIERQLSIVERDGARVGYPDTSLIDYHQLRIDVKRLRYALEFFEDVLGPEARDAIESLKVLQDYLGELQDTIVAAHHLKAVIQYGTWQVPRQPDALWDATPVSESPGDSEDGLLAYLRFLEGEIDALLKGAPDVWRRFQAAGPAQLIDDAMAALEARAAPHPRQSRPSKGEHRMSQEPTYIVLMGPPGAGKGTQAERLSERLKLPHVASGDLFRYHLKNETELGLEAKSYMEEGELVPDGITIAMVLDRLSRPDCDKGALLDGFPRTVTQAKALDEALEVEAHEIDLVLNIQVHEDDLITRITGRRVCRSCGATYHVKYDPPEEPGICDKCGGELYQRDDDTEEVVRNRLQVYDEQTRPVLDYYREQGILVNIDGNQGIDDVTETLTSAIKKRL